MRWVVGFVSALVLGVVSCSSTPDGDGTGWFRQDIGRFNPLISVSFVDGSVGTAVGVGTILRTTDGGATWQEQLTGPELLRLVDVSFTDADNGTAVGDLGTIVRTTDGGATWVEQHRGFPGLLYGVSFTDTDNGTAVGAQEGILRTTDGGRTWVEQRGGATGELNGVSFTDSNTGTAVGFTLIGDAPRALILRTINGGATWVEQDSGLGDADSFLRSVSFADADRGTAVGWVEDRPIILRTNNGGTSWVEQDSGLSEKQGDPARPIAFSRVCFTDANNGTVVGTRGTILRTRDAGATWVEQDSGTTTDLWGVSFTDANNGTAVGLSIILRTTGGGSGPFIETEPYCTDEPNETPCIARDGGRGSCVSGVCCYELRDPVTDDLFEVRCDDPGAGGRGGTGGAGAVGGVGGGGVGGAGGGGAGGSGGDPDACTNDLDSQVFNEVTYTDGAGIGRTGTDAVAAIGADCVFGSISADPRNPGCPLEAQAVLICASTGCPAETVQALADCVVACTQDIVELQTGGMLTDECAECYGGSVACSANLCATSGCSNPTSPSCIQCRCENECIPGFDRCSGLPPSGECD